MTTSPAEVRLEFIDGLRAIAALAIFVYHAWQSSGCPKLPLGLESTIPRLSNAVDLFIVLSGFCLFWPYAYSTQRLAKWKPGQYLRRRFLRIVPPYYLSIVFVLVLPNALVILWNILGKSADFRSWENLPWQLLTHLTFTHTLFKSTWSGLQGCYWTLGLEVQLYLAFIVVIPLYKRLGVLAILLMFIGSIVFRVLAAPFWYDPNDWVPEFLLGATFLGRWMQFAGGMAAAWVLSRSAKGRRAPIQSMGLWALAVVICSAGFPFGYSILPEFSGVAESAKLGVMFGATLVLAGALTNSIGAILSFTPLRWFGLMSYSFYLVHQNLIYYVAEGLRKLIGLQEAWLLACVLSVGLFTTWVVSFALYLAVEKPSLRLASRRVISKDDNFALPSSM